MVSKAAKELAKVVGRRIRQLRIERKWGQVRLVAQLDDAITQAAVSWLESGTHAPSFDTIIALSKAFNVPPALFFLRDDVARERLAGLILSASQRDLEAIAALLAVERRAEPEPRKPRRLKRATDRHK